MKIDMNRDRWLAMMRRLWDVDPAVVMPQVRRAIYDANAEALRTLRGIIGEDADG